LRTPYPNYQSPCGWNALLPPVPARPRLTADTKCDVVVIGGGYTGLSAARRWHELEPSHQIKILEGSRIGEGNPGRNSGFLLEVSLANDANAAEIDRMQKCNALVSKTMADLSILVRQHNIKCDLHRSGTYRAAAGEHGLQAIRAYATFLKASDLPHEKLDQKALRSRIGTNFYQEGLYSPDCYLVQPAALIRGLADALAESISVYEETPALKISRSGAAWIVNTPSGSISAQSVIIANNAFAKSLGFGRSRITAIYTYAGLTEPLPVDLLAQLGTDTSWGLLPAHRLGSTLRRTRDNRLLIRSCYDYEAEMDNCAIEAILTDALQRRFPFLDNTRLAHVWSGATGLTRNGAPKWGKIGTGLFISAGCNGGGVVKGTLFGSALADLAHDNETADIEGLFGTASWMPPDPMRKLGFKLIAAMERRRGVAEI